MKGLHKKVITGALALGLAFALSSKSHATESAKKLPAVGNTGGYFQTLDFYGVKTCLVNATTTAKLCDSGEGVLDAICPSGGTLGQYTLGLDTSVAGTRSVTNSDTLLLTPMVFTHTDTTSTPGGLPCYVPAKPQRYLLGLVGVQSSAGHTTVILYHKTNGSNP
jgi:hypothetical protein